MKSFIVVGLLAGAVTHLSAAEAPKFNPITIEEPDFRQLEQWAGEQPTKFGAPLLQWLYALKQRTDLKSVVQPESKREAPHE